MRDNYDGSYDTTRDVPANASRTTKITRSLILDARNELILPLTRDRLTFDNSIFIGDDLDEKKPPYELVEQAFARNYDMQALVTRRYLGEVGTISAYLLTPHAGKALYRNFAWQRRAICQVEQAVDDSGSSVDIDDSVIFRNFLMRSRSGEFGPLS